MKGVKVTRSRGFPLKQPNRSNFSHRMPPLLIRPAQSPPPPPKKKHWQGSTSANGARHVAETRTADAPVEPRNVRLSTSSPVANVYLVCLNAPLTVKDISNIIISSSGCRLIFSTSSSTEKMTLDYMLQVLTDGWTWGQRIHLNKGLISLVAAPDICLQLLNVNWASFFQLNKQLSVKESQF